MIVVAPLHLDPEAAAEMAVNAVLFYLAQCGIRNKVERSTWLRKVFDGICARVDRADNPN